MQPHILCRAVVSSAILIAASIACHAAAVGDEPIVTTDLLMLRTASSIDVSADGTKAVYAVRSVAQKKPASRDSRGRYRPAEYEYRSHLFVIDLLDPDSPPRQMTFGDRQDSSPKFSPDGRMIAFIRTPREGDNGTRRDDADEPSPERRPQIWLLPLAGGEAKPVTAFDEGVSDLTWSPTGAALVVSSVIPFDEIDGQPIWDLERPKRTWNDTAQSGETSVEPRPDGTRAQIRAWLDASAARENPSVITRLEFHDETSLRKPHRFAHLFLVDPFADRPSGVSHARRLTRDFADHLQPAFMPDGRRVVYSAIKSDGVHLDRIREHSLYVTEVDGSADELLFSRPGWSLTNPKPSSDGSVVVFTAQRQDEPSYRQRILGLVGARNASNNEPIWLTESLDRSISGFTWMAARGAILFSFADEGAFPLYRISPGLLEPTPVVDEAVGVHAFAAGGSAIVYAKSSPQNPAVIMAQTPQHGEWLAHDLNPWVHQKRLSFPTPGWIDRPDETRVQYWLMEPTDRKPGDTYPLCLQIHGGPSAMWGPGEPSMWLEFQLLCSWGYGVVYCNPRGSGGYGYAFQKANHQNWGHGPGGDVLAAVDRALAQDWVDPDRLLITGGSYAGYLTAWIIAHDHRFKAAVAQRGVYDLTTFFGEGNAWRLVSWAFGGHPWEASIRPILQRESPFTHVRQIRTPLLITHGSNDLRTGVSQSEMLYRALKVLNRPVEYVRYPGTGHDLSRAGDPRQRMDRLNRIIEFFERHINNPRPAPMITPVPSDSQQIETLPMMPIVPMDAGNGQGGG